MALAILVPFVQKPHVDGPQQQNLFVAVLQTLEQNLRARSLVLIHTPEPLGLRNFSYVDLRGNFFKEISYSKYTPIQR